VRGLDTAGLRRSTGTHAADRRERLHQRAGLRRPARRVERDAVTRLHALERLRAPEASCRKPSDTALFASSCETTPIQYRRSLIAALLIVARIRASSVGRRMRLAIGQMDDAVATPARAIAKPIIAACP
jgi:hypothetical protein